MKTLAGSVLVASSFAALPALAQVTKTIGAGLNSAAGGAGYGTGAVSTNQLPIIVGSLIGILLQLVGVLLLLYLIYAGFLWMTAGGDKGKVEKATTTIRNTIIGLVLIITAYSISGYILAQLSIAANVGTGTPTTPAGP